MSDLFIMLSVFFDNITSPAILFFFLGIVSGFVRSDLEIPEQISKFLSLYLMMAIGFKGGAAIYKAGAITSQMLFLMIAGVTVGFLQPFIAYFLLNKTTDLDKYTISAISAHYGSVSMVTFLTTINFLEEHGVSYAGYIIAIVALMETPAIVSGLLLAKKNKKSGLFSIFRDKNIHILTNGVIFLLIGALFVGFLSGKDGMQKMQGFVISPFQGFLSFFLLDMGLVVSRHITHLKEFNFRIFIFGIYMPLIGATIGLVISKLISLDIGTATLFTVLCASASYIAATVAMKNSLPEAKSGIYLPLSLAVTFPFNVGIGIPLYHTLVKLLLTH